MMRRKDNSGVLHFKLPAIAMDLEAPHDVFLFSYPILDANHVQVDQVENADSLVLVGGSATDLIIVEQEKDLLHFTFKGSEIVDCMCTDGHMVLQVTCLIRASSMKTTRAMVSRKFRFELPFDLKPKQLKVDLGFIHSVSIIDRVEYLRYNQSIPLALLEFNYPGRKHHCVTMPMKLSCSMVCEQSQFVFSGEENPSMEIAFDPPECAKEIEPSENVGSMTVLKQKLHPGSLVSCMEFEINPEMIPESGSMLISIASKGLPMPLGNDELQGEITINVIEGETEESYLHCFSVKPYVDRLVAIVKGCNAELVQDTIISQEFNLQNSLKFSNFSKDFNYDTMFRFVLVDTLPTNPPRKLTHWTVSAVFEDNCALEFNPMIQEGLDCEVGQSVKDSPFSIGQPTELDLTLNGYEAILDIEFSFRPEMVRTLHRDVAFSLTITCTVDPPCSDQPRDVFPVVVRGFIRKALSMYWLAVDYGTSVVVAAYTNKNDNIPLLRLNGRFKELIDAYRLEEFEGDVEPHMIRSSVLCNPEGSLDAQTYSEALFRIPPTMKELVSRQKPIIHDLKSLIGRDIVPSEIVSSAFQEQFQKPSGNVLHINGILKQVYAQLHSHFILPLLENSKHKEELNQVILTVPNSFTYKQLDVITESMTNLGIDRENVYIISESDAVACYYYDNWEAQKNDKEYVFVYDIGAGTIDITYFGILRHPNGRTEMRIIGRMTKACAGNYVDYVLACALERLFKQKQLGVELKEASILHSPDNTEDWKFWIRDHLKPNLARPEVIVPLDSRLLVVNASGTEGPVRIKTEKIVSSQEYQGFLNDATTDLVDEFFNLYKHSGTEWKRGGKPIIDAVMLTGRCSQVYLLKDRLYDAVKAHSAVENPAIRFMENIKHLKQSVLMGALIYARLFLQANRRGNQVRYSFTSDSLDAYYGIVYRKNKQGRQLVHAPILYPGLSPMNSIESNNSNLWIGAYENLVTDLDLSGSAEILVYKSYDDNPCPDIEKEEFKNTTILARLSSEMIYQPEKATVTMTISQDKKVTIKINSSRSSQLEWTGKELNKFERESAWPFLYMLPEQTEG
jgi:molecular chaperone DnaK (HSP70)